MNQLFFGDNLNILREHVKDETVDLVYLDPPFNSKRDYSVLFKTPKEAKKIVVSVKGGDNVNVAMVRDLGHVVEREKAAIGLFVTLVDPSRPMKEEAIKTGYYDADRFGTEYPKLQILTMRA
jgi:hypothetical protein